MRDFRDAGMRSGWSRLAAALLLAMAPGFGGARAGSQDAAPRDASAQGEAERIEAALQGVQGLVASFTQTIASPGLPSPRIETGTLSLLRPGRMRWEYDHPRGKLAIADGEKCWVYLPEEHAVLVGPLRSGGADRGMGLLLRDRIDLMGEFAVSWAAGEAGGERPLQLIPKTPRDEYRALLLTPGPDHLLRALAVVDYLGGRVTYRFEDVRRVASLDPSLFRFTPPPGADVEPMR